MAEFVNGFEIMASVGPAVTVFGSTRVGPESDVYVLAERTGRRLAREGFAVITGGGPGVMEACNKGAQAEGGVSIGFNIHLPHEQAANLYIDKGKQVTFEYFFVRKVMFMKYSQAFVALPGGFGTIDEVTEAITLIQTGKSQRFPVILVGKAYWEGLYHWIRETMYEANGYIGSDDLDFIFLEDDLDEMVRIIGRFYPEGYSLNF